jgi:integrase
MNRTLTIVRYAKLENGWRRGAVVMQRNGKLKHGFMMQGGVEILAPQGRYQMVRYEGNKPVYTDLGNDPTDAVNRFRSEESKTNVRVAAVAAGLEVVSPETSACKTLKQLASAYLEMHHNLPHRADDSVRVYTHVTASFLNLCKVQYPKQVTKEDVIRWHGWMRNEKRYSDRTCANHYIALRGFLRYCGLRPGEFIPKGTHKLLKTYTQKIVNTYSPEVVVKLMEAATDDNRALLWDFLYKTGLRDSEAQMVTRYDIHGLDTAEPMLHVKERDEYGNIKDAEERKIELHSSLVPQINKWLKDNPQKVLLFGTAADKPDVRMLAALKRVARRAGLNCGHCKGCKGKYNECAEYTLHRFRRTYTTRMLRATGGDLRSVMQRTGHSDLASVMRYLEPSAQIRAAIAQAF